MDQSIINELLSDSIALYRHIQNVLRSSDWHREISELTKNEVKHASVVLFLISQCPSQLTNGVGEVCLVLNKRSRHVKQAGDLCCPGGGLSWVVDNLYARLLRFPGSPLGRRRVWDNIGLGRLERQDKIRTNLPVLLAAGLREAWEEMRMNPLRFGFLGMLPKQHLVMFKRVIYPIVGWIPSQSFKSNWEVERVVRITFRQLLTPENYARFQPVIMDNAFNQRSQLQKTDFPCYIHNGQRGRELLWGATYRIVQAFLNLVFDFTPPQFTDLPRVEHQLDETYLNGSR